MKIAIIGTYWTKLKDARKDIREKTKLRKASFSILKAGKAYLTVSDRQLE